MRLFEYFCLHFAGLLFFCWLCEAAAGGCSRYGHACWGGHGKRSSHAPLPVDERETQMEDVLTNEDTADEMASQDAEEVVQELDRRHAFQVEKIGASGLADFLPIASGQDLHSSEPEEIREENRKMRPQSQRSHKYSADDVRVLIIPDESQLPDLQIYQILSQKSRKSL